MKFMQSLFGLFGTTLLLVAKGADFYEFDLDDPYSPISNGEQPVALNLGD